MMTRLHGAKSDSTPSSVSAVGGRPVAGGAIAGDVLLITPGGIDQRGGMGSVVRTLVESWNDREGALRLRVVDPWPFEWRLGFAPRSLLSFASAIGTVLKVAAAGRLAIVHVHMAGGGSVARKSVFVWLGRLFGARVIVHSAAADLDSLWQRLPASARRLLRATLQRADVVVTLGGYWQRFLIREVGLRAERVLVIPNGVVDPGPPLARPVAPPCRLLFVGRLGERKGTPILLDALAKRELSDLDWTLTLAGDGEVDAMRRRAEQLGITDRCRFAGWLSTVEISALMRGAEILVLPSQQEGLPMAILEGMAHGLAIVSTDAGAIGDAVTDGVNGRLVPAGDQGALATALADLISDAPQRRACQAAARQRFLDDYEAGTFAHRFADLYERVLSTSSSNRPSDRTRPEPYRRLP